MDIDAALKTLVKGREHLEQVLTQVRGQLPPQMIQRMEGLRDLSDALEELLSTHAMLYGDLAAVIKLLQEKPRNQLWRRAAYRAAFAWVEGTLFTMKQYALKAAAVYQVELTPEEVFTLSERQAQLSDRGQLKIRNWYLDAKANLRFAFSITPRCHGMTFELETDGQGWEEFVTSFEVRNRLTHPKSMRQLEVSDEEAAILYRTCAWFSLQVEAVARGCLQAQTKLQQRFDDANRTYIDDLKLGFTEPLKRILAIEQVERHLVELTDQVDQDEWRHKTADAKEQLAQLKQHFVSQLTKK